MRILNTVPRLLAVAPARILACCLATSVSSAIYKSFLQERCQALGIAVPSYELLGERGPKHERTYHAAVRVDNHSFKGTWQRSRKLAEASAAQCALSSFSLLGQTSDQMLDQMPIPRTPPRQELQEIMEVNAWPRPRVMVAERVNEMHTARVAVRVPGRWECTFEGKAPRRKQAIAAGCEAALVSLHRELESDPANAGKWEKLRDGCYQRGLLLQATTNTLHLGGKERVLRLESTTPNPVGTCPVWSGLHIETMGMGTTKQACLDAAAAEALRRLQGFPGARTAGLPVHALDLSGTQAVSERVPSYSPTQTVVVSNRRAECDEWVREWVRASMGTQGREGARVVGLDCEWTSRSQGVSLLQLATERGCLLAHGAALGSTELIGLLADPSVAKVGKDLREDWPRLRRTLAALCPTQPLAASRHTAGWHELVDFMPFHTQRASLSALTTAFLGSTYDMKGTVDHNEWDRWPIPERMRTYAAADVCAVIDVLLASHRARE